MRNPTNPTHGVEQKLDSECDYPWLGLTMVGAK